MIVKSLLMIMVCVAIACANLFGQAMAVDTLQGRIDSYNYANPSDVLYLVTDKQVYLPTETIWFAAYIIDQIGGKDSTLQPDILSVALLRSDTSGISLRKNYLIKNWTSEGSFTLPDTLSPGNYLLLACTNLADGKGRPIHVFRMPLTIKSATIPMINVDFEVNEPGADSIFVFARTHFPSGISASDRRNAQVIYQLEEGKQKKAKYNFEGLAKIGFSRSELTNTGSLLRTVTKIGTRTKQFSVRLPIPESDKLAIGFYPEGGNLVTGLLSRVAWQVSLKDGSAGKVKVVLLENGKVIDTIETDINGTGIFDLRPVAKAEYGVKILEEAGSGTVQIYSLPPALPSGVVLNVADPLAADTLTVDISASIPSQLSIAVSSQYTRETIVSQLPAFKGQGKRFKIPLADVKRGLNTLTLLDAFGRPVAERLFFAHFNKGVRASLSTDKDIYQTREKVSLKVSLTNADQQPIAGLFTVSCVQQSRLDSSARQDLPAYYYMKPILKDNQQSVLNSTASLINNSAYLERMLMIRGWRRYLWQDMLRSDIDTAKLGLRVLALRAQFKLADGGKLEKPMIVNISKDSTLSTALLTDQNGYINPKVPELTIVENRNLDIRLLDKKGLPVMSTFQVEDPMKQLMEQVHSIPREALIRDVSMQRSRDLLMARNSDQPNLLQEVSITSRLPLVKANGYGPNGCGDYVCVSGYLNCLVHSAFDPENRPPPVKGKTYHIMFLGPAAPGVRNIIKNVYNVGDITYQGCLWEQNELAIFTARQFYGMDSAKVKKTDEMEYLSTVFWKAFTTSSLAKPNVFEFYTGDLTGAFKIRVEGFSEDGDLYYEEKNIDIKR